MALKFLSSLWKTIKGQSGDNGKEKDVDHLSNSDELNTWKHSPDVTPDFVQNDHCVSNSLNKSQDFSVRKKESSGYILSNGSANDWSVDEYFYSNSDCKYSEYEREEIHNFKGGGESGEVNFYKDSCDVDARFYNFEQGPSFEKYYTYTDEDEYFYQVDRSKNNYDSSKVSAVSSYFNSDNNNIFKHFEKHLETLYGSSEDGCYDLFDDNYEKNDYSTECKDYPQCRFDKEYCCEKYQCLYHDDDEYSSEEESSSNDEDENFYDEYNAFYGGDNFSVKSYSYNSSDEYWDSKYKEYMDAYAQGRNEHEVQYKDTVIGDIDRDSADRIQMNSPKIDEIKSDEAHKAVSQSLTLQCEHKFMENLLFQFYEHLHDYLRKKYSVSEHSVKLAMQNLIFNYKNLNKCETPQPLDFNDIPTCLGYLHRYAICHAALVYHAITKVLVTSTRFLSIFSKEKLDMMCLGSGPGNDFIGFAFALMNLQIKILNIDVTVVDMFSGWYTIFSETIDMFNSLTKNAYENPSKTFIQADLSNFSSWNSFMKNRLNDADIVSLVKVLSNISKDSHSKTLKNIIGLMKDDAFLIIIDCPLPSAELSALQHFLYPVYSSSREKFNFKEKKKRFGYPNISQCTAYIRVYKKRNSYQFT